MLFKQVWGRLSGSIILPFPKLWYPEHGLNSQGDNLQSSSDRDARARTGSLLCPPPVVQSQSEQTHELLYIFLFIWIWLCSSSFLFCSCFVNFLSPAFSLMLLITLSSGLCLKPHVCILFLCLLVGALVIILCKLVSHLKTRSQLGCL